MSSAEVAWNCCSAPSARPRRYRLTTRTPQRVRSRCEIAPVSRTPRIARKCGRSVAWRNGSGARSRASTRLRWSSWCPRQRGSFNMPEDRRGPGHVCTASVEGRMAAECRLEAGIELKEGSEMVGDASRLDHLGMGARGYDHARGQDAAHEPEQPRNPIRARHVELRFCEQAYTPHLPGASGFSRGDAHAA